MIKKLVNEIINMQLRLQIIDELEIEIYQYGYILFVELLINIAISFIISIFMGTFTDLIFFLCAFVPLRSYCGGYHADKSWKCIILSNLIVLAVIKGSLILQTYIIHLYFYIIIIFCLAISIIRLAPVDSNKKKLNVKERKYYKKCVYIVVFFEFLMSILFFVGGYQKQSNIVLLIYIIQNISLLIALL